ncbi:acyltransferase [Streptomyces sp. AV19]|uniref:acyltransferase family protein n=1 Tax=Streptomyces sp. AV19 TaxID=2793068 RepID=UPI0018FE100B|nr:acyltransferase [Streptomyces sp. AV19]MBH1934906.1 acyltransferase [Streptomyces sp. AV19]MDG4537041.1 acyltransferase [Streptomyces sp. AV19]
MRGTRGETAARVASGSSSSGARARLFYVDNLRIVLTALVVLHHTAVTYSDIPVWFYTEGAEDPSGKVLDGLIVLNQAFSMGFFFMIAGFFTPGSYERKGARPFLRDRWKRLGIPLLAFLLVVRPLVNFGSFGQVREEFAKQGVHELPYWVFYLVTWDAGPMWFVEVLLVFTMAYVWLRRRRRPAVVRGPLRGWSVVAFGAGLAVVTYGWRIVVPSGSYLPVLGLPSPDYLPQYASFFALGAMAWRSGWAQSLSRRAGRIGFAVAGAATAAYVPVVVLSPQRALDGHGTWQSLVVAVWESAFAIGVVVGLVVLFRERFNRRGSVGEFLSRHAFTVYLMHPVVLVGLGYGFRWLDAPAVVKFVVVGVVAVPVCWGVAWVVRRLPGADRVL